MKNNGKKKTVSDFGGNEKLKPRRLLSGYLAIRFLGVKNGNNFIILMVNMNFECVGRIIPDKILAPP